MKNLMVVLVCVSTLLLGFQGCGTITTGGKQSIGLNSAPAGATVKVSKTGMGAQVTNTTPATVEFERKGSYVLTFEKEGYAPQQLELR